MTSSTTTQLTAVPTTDAHGVPCLGIPLSGNDGQGRFALIDADGLEALRSAGARALYLWNDGAGRAYVAFVSFVSRRRRRAMTAARAILGDPQGRRIEYANGDRLDLRSRNLYAREYAGVGACRAEGVAR